MSQRLTTPLMWLGDRPLYPFCGAEGGEQGGTGSGTESQTSTGQQGGTGSGDGASGAGGSSGTSKDTYSKEEFEQLQARLAASDRDKMSKVNELQTLQAWKEEQERKGATELENATRDRDKFKGDSETLAAENTDLKAQLEFLKSSSVTWHNPGAALTLLKSQTNNFADLIKDGKVDEAAMKSAIANLAKDNEFLVKKDAESGKDDGKGGKSGGSGAPPGGAGGKGGNSPAVDNMQTRFPSLRGRLANN